MLLFVVGTICLTLACIASAGAANAKVAADGIHPDTQLALVDKQRRPDDAPQDAEVIGRLVIPDLKLSVPILSGDDSPSLQRGVGHIPGTAFPGGLGNVGLAGHRDIYLRPIRNITAGMEIKVVQVSGTYSYKVDSTEVVAPTEVRVLDINSRPELTLVTCYPFYFVGNAPKRFIVHAHLLSALPDTRE